MGGGSEDGKEYGRRRGPPQRPALPDRKASGFGGDLDRKKRCTESKKDATAIRR